MISKKVTGTLLALSAAAVFSMAPAISSAEEGKMIKCMGINSCKGKSSCKTANNSCKGKNSCKGQGMTMTTKDKCDKKGGKMMMDKEDK